MRSMARRAAATSARLRARLSAAPREVWPARRAGLDRLAERRGWRRRQVGLGPAAQPDGRRRGEQVAGRAAGDARPGVGGGRRLVRRRRVGHDLLGRRGQPRRRGVGDLLRRLGGRRIVRHHALGIGRARGAALRVQPGARLALRPHPPSRPAEARPRRDEQQGHGHGGRARRGRRRRRRRAPQVRQPHVGELRADLAHPRADLLAQLVGEVARPVAPLAGMAARVA